MIDTKLIHYIIFSQTSMIKKILKSNEKIDHIIEKIPFSKFSLWDNLDSELVNMTYPKELFYTFKGDNLLKQFIYKYHGKVVVFTFNELKNIILKLLVNMHDPLNFDIIICDNIVKEILNVKMFYIPKISNVLEPFITKLPNGLQILLHKKTTTLKKLLPSTCSTSSINLNVKPQNDNETDNILSKKIIKKVRLSVSPYMDCISVALTSINNKLVFWTESMNNFEVPNSLFFLTPPLRNIIENVKSFDKNQIVFSLPSIYQFIICYIKELNLEICPFLAYVYNNPLGKLFNVNTFHFDQIKVLTQKHIIFAGIHITPNSLLVNYIPITSKNK